MVIFALANLKGVRLDKKVDETTQSIVCATTLDIPAHIKMMQSLEDKNR
jgi:hypothetical protein